MKAISLAAVACLFLTAPALAMTEAECTTPWKQADTSGDGVLNGTEAGRYSAMISIANKTTDVDGAMSETIFSENCKAGVFNATSVDPGAPLEGANSFTESQAKDRVAATGITMPKTMTKDDKGVWRGASMSEGRSVNVAVDYKGNVVKQ